MVPDFGHGTYVVRYFQANAVGDMVLTAAKKFIVGEEPEDSDSDDDDHDDNNSDDHSSDDKSSDDDRHRKRGKKGYEKWKKFKRWFHR